MQSFYAPQATFTDEVFVDLNSDEVKAMWQMLITRGKDLQITYGILKETDDFAEAEWTAHYTFSASGRKVTNVIHSRFHMEHGKIVSHRDSFDFYRWASQALGWKGVLLGHTKFLRNKVTQGAMASLHSFMKKAKFEE